MNHCLQGLSKELYLIIKQNITKKLTEIITQESLVIDKPLEKIIQKYTQQIDYYNHLQQSEYVIVNRCAARKKDNKQCRRKTKDGYRYCGVHKGEALKQSPSSQSIESNDLIQLWYRKIDNKLYLIDKDNNIYENSENPSIIGYYYKNSILFY